MTISRSVATLSLLFAVVGASAATVKRAAPVFVKPTIVQKPAVVKPNLGQERKHVRFAPDQANQYNHNGYGYYNNNIDPDIQRLQNETRIFSLEENLRKLYENREDEKKKKIKPTFVRGLMNKVQSNAVDAAQCVVILYLLKCFAATTAGDATATWIMQTIINGGVAGFGLGWRILGAAASGGAQASNPVVSGGFSVLDYLHKVFTLGA